MIYPKSAEQRDRFEAAAKAKGRGLSPFIVETVEQYLEDEHRMAELRDRHLMEKIRRQDKDKGAKQEEDTAAVV
jgi:predicted DNA-binding protein